MLEGRVPWPADQAVRYRAHGWWEGITTAAMLARSAEATLELAAFGVCVNAIAPGPFPTRITTPELRAIWKKALPVRRVAFTDELQQFALFLASLVSAYVTGAQFAIDSGSMLGRSD